MIVCIMIVDQLTLHMLMLCIHCEYYNPLLKNDLVYPPTCYYAFIIQYYLLVNAAMYYIYGKLQICNMILEDWYIFYTISRYETKVTFSKCKRSS